MSVSDINSLKAQYIFVVKVIIHMEEIPSDLVINWDESINQFILFQFQGWMMAKESSK